jgi:hypothetical protein
MSFSLLFRRLVIYCGCVVVAGAFSLSSPAELAPISMESTVTPGAMGDQVLPHAAINRDGGYLVWQDNSVTTLGPRIVAKRLGIDLSPEGSILIVGSAAKSKTAGDQEKPQVALLPSGGAVFVWQGGKPGLQQIYARFVSADNVLEKKDVRVGKSTKINQINPAVAVLSDGTVIVVWASFDQDGSRQGIFAQLLSADGKRLGNEFPVNQFVLNNQRNPAVAALADGRFVVSWVSELQRNPASSVDIFARMFLPDGTPAGNEFPVSVSTTNACANPSLAASPTGGFAVAWSQRDDVGQLSVGVIGGSGRELSQNGWDVYVRTFDFAGAPVALPVRLNTESYGDQYVPRLTALGASYVGVWTSLGQDGSREGIYGQAFGFNGDFQGTQFRVNTTTLSRQIHPAIAGDGEGKCLAVWSSIEIGSGFDLFTQTYFQTGQ